MVETIHPTTQNNGQPMDNVRPEWQLDQLKISLAFYVNWSRLLILDF